MYKSTSFSSDLVNSYAWDTTLVFLQNYSGDSKYSLKTSVNTTEPLKSGSTGDVACNIYDMASNLCEFTTERSTRKDNDYLYCMTIRGGSYASNSYTTSNRKGTWGNPFGSPTVGFRVMLYL